MESQLLLRETSCLTPPPPKGGEEAFCATTFNAHKTPKNTRIFLIMYRNIMSSFSRILRLRSGFLMPPFDSAQGSTGKRINAILLCGELYFVCAILQV